MSKKKGKADVVPVPVDAMAQALMIWKGRPVLLASQIDQLHGKAPKHTANTIKRLIDRGRMREGRDLVVVKAKEFNRLMARVTSDVTLEKHVRSDIQLVLKPGYFRVIKTFDDPLAWDIYERVVDDHLEAHADPYDPAIRRYLLPVDVDPEDPEAFYKLHAPDLADALGKTDGAPILGLVVLEYVYKFLLPEERFIEELRSRNQKDEDSGRRQNLHHQHITRIGKEKVLSRCHEISVMLFGCDYKWGAFKARYWQYYGEQRIKIEFEASEKRVKDKGVGQLFLDFKGTAKIRDASKEETG